MIITSVMTISILSQILTVNVNDLYFLNRHQAQIIKQDKTNEWDKPSEEKKPGKNRILRVTYLGLIWILCLGFLKKTNGTFTTNLNVIT